MNEAERAEWSKAYAGIHKANSVIIRTSANRSFRDAGSNTSIRDGYSRQDYDYFRPEESIPTDPHEIQKACMQAYDRFGLVRNIIDMMADFVAKGIDIVHPSPRYQKLGRDWFKKVAGKEVTTKIATMLFKAAAAPVRRVIRKFNDETIKAIAASSSSPANNEYKPLKDGEIPMGYTILNPTSLEVIGGDLALFVGNTNFQYGVRIPAELYRSMKNSGMYGNVNITNVVPKDLLKKAVLGNGLIPIPKDRLKVIHYKKDDFVLWAKPIIYPILDDLLMLEKLKLADRSALDGAISHVRVWKIGNLEHKIPPTKAAVERLAEMLLNNVGGGCMDLIWGPDIELIETGTEVYKVLGNEKYIPTLTSIFQGLGVPPTLTGTSADAGFTNNTISLKILVERLNYCRDVLTSFWEQELKIIQSVFGIRDDFTLTFDTPTVTDDSSSKKLLIDLVDRNIISEEYVVEQFGGDPDIEKMRIMRQERWRKKEKLPPKAGPYHIDSTQKAQLERLFTGLGELTPTQVGLELDEKKEGELTPNESRGELAEENGGGVQDVKTEGKPGRPLGSGDTVKRKQKTAGPLDGASASRIEFTKTVLWTSSAQSSLDEILNPIFLGMRGKKNLRQLSSKDSTDLDDLKFKILCSLNPYQDINEDIVLEKVNSNLSIEPAIKSLYLATVVKFVEQKGVNPSIEESRKIQAMAYSLWNFKEREDGEG